MAKPQETKMQFIQLRAEGQSYSNIAKELNISKSTCTSWERELQAQIQEYKSEQLKELYNSYFMTKEARVKRLGETLAEIDTALKDIDYSMIPPDKLLDYKLKYMDALKEEYTGVAQPYLIPTENIAPTDIVNAMADLLNRVRLGEISNEQAQKETTVITNLLKAYETVEIKTQLETLNSILGGRR